MLIFKGPFFISVIALHVTLVYIYLYKWISLQLKINFKIIFIYINDQRKVISEQYMETQLKLKCLKIQYWMLTSEGVYSIYTKEKNKSYTR